MSERKKRPFKVSNKYAIRQMAEERRKRRKAQLKTTLPQSPEAIEKLLQGAGQLLLGYLEDLRKELNTVSLYGDLVQMWRHEHRRQEIKTFQVEAHDTAWLLLALAKWLRDHTEENNA